MGSLGTVQSISGCLVKRYDQLEYDATFTFSSAHYTIPVDNVSVTTLVISVIMAGLGIIGYQQRDIMTKA